MRNLHKKLSALILLFLPAAAFSLPFSKFTICPMPNVILEMKTANFILLERLSAHVNKTVVQQL